jgi:thiol-disulfide isomerase/thioredoxin
MRRILTLALAVALLAAGCAGDEGDETAGGASDLPGPVPTGVTFDEPRINVQAPDFTAELLDGTPLTASELWQERPVVLVFTASWCERCREIDRDVTEAADEHDGAIAVLGVVPDDDAEQAKEYASELDLGHAIAVADDQVWLDYAAREPPVVVLVAKGGKVLRGFPGGISKEDLAPRLEEFFERS